MSGSAAGHCHEQDEVAPRIDHTSCEGKAECALICPYDVFEIRKPTAAEHKALPFMAKLKVFVHGGKQGFVARPDACQACGLCVHACPEKAIRLVKR